LANTHNLYGPTNEAFITIQRDGSWKVTKLVRGSTSQEMLSHMNWEPREVMQTVEKLVLGAGPDEHGDAGKEFLRRFRRVLNGYVYMNTVRGATRVPKRRPRNV
jgi:arginine decarboxylase-like protein